MSDSILGKTVGPAADYGERGDGRGRGGGGGDGHCGVEDAGEFEARDGGDLVVVAAGDAVGGKASEKGADEAAAGRDAVRELLVGEGAGEEEARSEEHT